MLKATRYANLSGNPLRDEKVKKWIRHGLPNWSFNKAMKFYREKVPHFTNAETALLGANDRFYLLAFILNRKDAQNEWLYKRCREVEAEPDNRLDLWARGHYKDKYIYEAVLTTEGWTKHGDLKVGDQVFDPNGKPVKVLARTETYTDSECYKITFDDGETTICGGGHEWVVGFNNRKRISGTNKRVGKDYKKVNTEELFHWKQKHDSVAHNKLHPLTIDRNKALQFPERDLPVEPYTLGAWLGDGHSNSGRITCGDPEVFKEIENDGYEVGARTNHDMKHAPSRTVYGLQAQLKKINVFSNKNTGIPFDYLKASIPQRLALLQGLMDTDGHIESRGTCTFVNTSLKICELVRDLAMGLGYKVQFRRYENGHGFYWQVSFQSRKSMCPFRIPRKAAKCLDRDDMRGRSIVSVERTETVPTNCIQVEGGMYLSGRGLIPTCNSTIITFAGAIQENIINPEITIAIFSETKEISRKFLGQIKFELETNEKLKTLYSDVFFQNPEKESPLWAQDRGIINRRKTNPKEASIEAHGLIVGMPTSRHFDLLIFDDVITQEYATKKAKVEDAIEKIQLSVNLGKPNFRQWYVGTRYSFGDPYGWLIGEKMVIVRLHPATIDGTENGTPVFLTVKQWNEWKRKQPDTFWAQMLQDPLTGKNQMFKPENFHSYEIRPHTLTVYIMCDPASGRSGRDETAMVVIGIDGSRNMYLLDGYSHKMLIDERWRNLVNLRKRWLNAPGVAMLEVGYEKFGMQADLEYFNQKMEEGGEDNPSFHIEELSWTKDGTESKQDRVQRMTANFKDGSFLFPNVVRRAGEVDGQTGYFNFEWQMMTDKSRVEDIGIHYKPVKGLSHRQQKMVEQNAEYRNAKPIQKLDEQGRPYDLTMKAKKQFIYFPLGQNDDIVDAIARIYDMDFKPPVSESGHYKDLSNLEFDDA